MLCIHDFFYKHGEFSILSQTMLIFFSNLTQFHAQSMLIFFSNLTQPCLFLVLEKSTVFTFFKEKAHISCFKAKISPKDKEKHDFGQIIQLYKVNYAYFQGGNDLAMLIIWKNLSQPCLFCFQFYLSHAQSMLIFFSNSILAMLINFMLIKRKTCTVLQTNSQTEFDTDMISSARRIFIMKELHFTCIIFVL